MFVSKTGVETVGTARGLTPHFGDFVDGRKQAMFLCALEISVFKKQVKILNYIPYFQNETKRADFQGSRVYLSH